MEQVSFRDEINDIIWGRTNVVEAFELKPKKEKKENGKIKENQLILRSCMSCPIRKEVGKFNEKELKEATKVV